MSVSPGRIGRAGNPVVDLLLHNVWQLGMLAGEDGEVLRRYDQGQYRLDRDDAGGPDATWSRAALADKVARHTFGDDPFPAPLLDADFRLPVEDHHHAIGPFALAHQRGTSWKGSLLRGRYQVTLLGSCEGGPEGWRVGPAHGEIAD